MIVTASRRQIGLRRSVNLAYRRLCHGEQGIGTTAKGFFVVAKFVFLSALVSSTKLEAHPMSSAQNNSSVVAHLRVKITVTQCPKTTGPGH
jgi:hypothetical protein